MKKYIILLVLSATLISPSIFSADDFTPTYKPTINAVRIDGQVKIDGRLDESIWQQAAVADGFVENSPADQEKPDVHTKAMIAYDDKNLYVAFVASDDPTTIRASYSDRDHIFRDDYIGLMLDTYDNQSWGYEIFVNPYGIQGDLRMSSNSGEEMSFDIIWESMGIITDSGYQVEIAIPFSSLRFPDKEKQNWRINFWRDRQREVRYRYTWAAQDRDDPCFLCQWGYLTGIENIKPGNNLEIMPSVVSYQSGYRETFLDPESDFINEDPDGELSLNIRYALNSNSSVEATYQPDFSQVESDGAQIDVNTTFGLHFQETRPFFQEGGELYRTNFNTVYTRSINDPIVATKFTGQFGRTSIAYLFARDENSPLLIPLQQQSAFTPAGKSTANILRIRQSLFEDSYIGLMVTDRHYDDFGDNDMHKGGFGTLFGFDTRLRFWKNFTLQSQLLFSKSEEAVDAHPFNDDDGDTDSLVVATNQSTFDNGKYTIDQDGEEFTGNALHIGLSRNSNRWSAGLSYQSISPTFRADNGNMRSNDKQNLNFNAGMNFRPNKKFLIEWGPSFMIGRTWTYDGKLNISSYENDAFDEWVRLELDFSLIHQTEIEIGYLASQERFFGENFPGISRGSVFIYSRFSEYANIGLVYEEGNTIYRDRYDPDLGYIKEGEIFADFKPTNRMTVDPSFRFASMDRRDEYFENGQHAGEYKDLYNVSIFRVRINYQFTRKLFMRLIVQYVDQTEYANNTDDPNNVIKEKYEYNSFSFEPLLTYKINPFTKFYIGMSSNYNGNREFEETNLLVDNDNMLNNRQFFAKFQYLFQL